MDDFHTFCRLTATLRDGAFINLGSAVIMPEVFLKALSLTRNLGYDVDGFTAINMDFIKQYRPTVNVVQRPTSQSGRGYNFIGHHEIMFPLLMSLVLENMLTKGVGTGPAGGAGTLQTSGAVPTAWPPLMVKANIRRLSLINPILWLARRF
jgi:hypothetical protein